jgi:hypothetical protein
MENFTCGFVTHAISIFHFPFAILHFLFFPPPIRCHKLQSGVTAVETPYPYMLSSPPDTMSRTKWPDRLCENSPFFFFSSPLFTRRH